MTIVMTMVMKAKARARVRRNRGLPRAELRQRIAQAALRLFHEAGYDTVSVDQIVARAAVSKGTFFNFFPTKADVLLVYFDEIDGRLAALRAKLDPRQPERALEKFFAKAETLLRSEGPLIETLTRAIVRIAQLTEDLPLAAHHGVQAHSGTEQVADSGLPDLLDHGHEVFVRAQHPVTYPRQRVDPRWNGGVALHAMAGR